MQQEINIEIMPETDTPLDSRVHGKYVHIYKAVRRLLRLEEGLAVKVPLAGLHPHTAQKKAHVFVRNKPARLITRCDGEFLYIGRAHKLPCAQVTPEWSSEVRQ